MLLTGGDGLGRKTLVQFLGHWSGIEIQTPPLMHRTSLQHFTSFFKEAILTAGIKDKRIGLFLEEFQLIDETILHLVHDLLSYGKVSLY